jgi:hypothetical protein
VQATGLRTYAWNNALKSALLLAGFPVLLVLLCFAVALLLVAWAEDSVGQGLRHAAGLVPAVVPVAPRWPGSGSPSPGPPTSASWTRSPARGP